MDYERKMNTVLVISILILIISQVLLTNIKVRSLLSVDHELQGSALKREEFLYKRGMLIIEKINKKENVKPIIYLNGEIAGKLDEEAMKLEVLDGDVIESSIPGEMKSAGIMLTLFPTDKKEQSIKRHYKIKNQITKLLKVKLKNY